MGLLEKILVGLNDDIDGNLSTSLDSPIKGELKSRGIQVESTDKSQKVISSPLPKKSSQVVQVSQLPLKLKLSNYKNAYSNANPEGDMLTALKFQQLVDTAPVLSHDFMTSTSSIESVYGQIVNGATSPVEDTFLTSMIANAKRAFSSSAQAQLAGQDEWRLVEAVPSDWYTDIKSRYKKVKISLDGKSKEKDKNNLGLVPGKSSQTTLTIGGQQFPLSNSTQFTHCEIEYMLVRFVRTWMNFALFETGGWWLTGQQPGYCSSGKADQNNTGVLPLITTGMILVRSAKFEGSWDPADKKKVEESLNSGKEVYVGPYRLLKDEDTASTVTLAAWISELLPLSPKTEEPVPCTVKVNNKGAYVARFSATWKIDGKEEKQWAEEFPALTNKEIKVPALATDITIEIEIMTWPLPKVWSTVKVIQLKKPEVLEYELSGTTFKPKLEKK
jgi:hypothetical protein